MKLFKHKIISKLQLHELIIIKTRVMGLWANKICMSAYRAANQPIHSANRSVDRVQPRLMHASQSTVLFLQSTGRSIDPSTRSTGQSTVFYWPKGPSL